MKISCRPSLSLALALLPATGAAQSTIHVPGDQPTIQAGIDAAINGDTVLVAPGTYTEDDVTFGGKAITVMSSGGADVTIVQADRTRVFNFAYEGADSVLDGFTITRTNTSAAGGISIHRASPTITRCKFVANRGAISAGFPGTSATLIEECEFRDNIHHGATGLGGAAILASYEATMEITDCSFVGNGFLDDTLGGNGGAVAAWFTTVVFTRCTFLGNRAGDAMTLGMVNGGWGGALYSFVSVVAVRSCRFESNLAGTGVDKPGSGGAIAIVGGEIDIQNSIFARNLAGAAMAPMDGTHVAAALHAGRIDPVSGEDIGVPYQVTVLNSTFLDNGVLDPKGDGGVIMIEDGTDVSFRNTILWGGLPLQIDSLGAPASVTYSIVEGGHAGTGNFHADPLLGPNHHLLSGSPAIDAGDPDVTGLPATDCEGDARVLGGTVDIGADEFGARVFPYGCGVNPADSIVVLAGTPTIGTTLVLGLDNPLGTQTSGALAPLVLSLSAGPGFPCGTLIPGFGMAGSGAAGELLIDLSATAVIQSSLWVGPGVPAPVLLPIPNRPDLNGLNLYVQGVLVDLSPGADPIVGITGALQLVIGF